jgi:hypothetical protein
MGVEGSHGMTRNCTEKLTAKGANVHEGSHGMTRKNTEKLNANGANGREGGQRINEYIKGMTMLFGGHDGGGVRMDDKGKGLYGKYRIEKTDGSALDPEAVYFTMRLDTDRFARAAVRAYVVACLYEEPELAKDLERVLRELKDE